MSALLDDPAGGHVFEDKVGKISGGILPKGGRPASERSQRIAEAQLLNEVVITGEHAQAENQNQFEHQINVSGKLCALVR